jgi:hypothetical protein
VRGHGVELTARWVIRHAGEPRKGGKASYVKGRKPRSREAQRGDAVGVALPAHRER